MTSACLRADALLALRERFPWPAARPSWPRIEWTLDYGGRQLVTDYLKKSAARIIAEVGSFLGGSVRAWLEAAPAASVVAIDTWQWRDPTPRLLQLAAPEILEQLRAAEGFHGTFLSNLWEHRQRVVPMRRKSPQALYELAEVGVIPDLIYLDADKKGRELDVASELFPDATIAGDDWWWGREQGYQIRKPVCDFCRRHGFHLRTHKMTWIIERQPRGIFWKTLYDRATDVPWALGQLLRPTIQRPRMLDPHGVPHVGA